VPVLDSDWDTENFINEIRSAISAFAEDSSDGTAEMSENLSEKEETENVSDVNTDVYHNNADSEYDNDKNIVDDAELAKIIEMTEKLEEQQTSVHENTTEATVGNRPKKKFGRK
jgi:hypothetical protein